jgi:sugar phosphate isomerase/epimerase
MQKAAHLGFDGVELLVVRPDELSADEIRTQVSDAGLEVAAIGTGAIYLVDKVTLLASDPEISHKGADRLEALIGFAAAVGAPIVTIGSFRGRVAWAGGPDARGKLAKILRVGAEMAMEQGIRLVLEPVNRYEGDIVHTAEEALGFIQEVGHSHLGLLLDTYHANIEEASLTEPFRKAMTAGRLWHVHLGDSNRLPPGQGHMDFPGIVATLGESGYQGYLSAELLPRPNPDAAAEATIRHMRQLVPAVG